MGASLQRLQWMRGHADGVADLAERLGPWWAEFRAWWVGDEPPSGIAPAAAPVQADATHAAPEGEDPDWPPPRIRLVQRIWGEGFTDAGGAEFAKTLALPLDLKSGKSVLDLTAGLGGTGRALFQSFGAHVTGIEANPALAAAGKALSTQMGMAETASVDWYDPSRLELAQGFDCILAREGFCAGDFRVPLLETAAKALKPGGRLLLVDFVRAEAASELPALDRWAVTMPGRASPLTADEFASALEKLGLKVAASEDITGEYRRAAMGGWHEFLESLALRDLTRPERFALVDEAERWMYRMAAFDAGELRVCRLCADA